MAHLASHLRSLFVAAVCALTVASPAAAADCFSIGQQVAAQNGGKLLRASADTRGGKAVCVIVVVVPGKDGARDQRQEIVVPAG